MEANAEEATLMEIARFGSLSATNKRALWLIFTRLISATPGMGMTLAAEKADWAVREYVERIRGGHTMNLSEVNDAVAQR